jgi:hypothetical protein
MPKPLAALALVSALAAVASAQAPAAAPSPSPSPSPSAVPITIQSAQAEGVSVSFLNIPWGPQTFAAMERPGDSFYNKRTWPFARMESKVALTLEGTKIPAGNYALVFHPNSPANEGISLEARRIAEGEFLQAGNAMTRTPEGETVFKAPIRFETASSTAASLKVEVASQKGAITLRIHYGDRLLTRELKL